MTISKDGRKEEVSMCSDFLHAEVVRYYSIQRWKGKKGG